MKKKLITLFLSLCMLFAITGLTACDVFNESTTEQAEGLPSTDGDTDDDTGNDTDDTGNDTDEQPTTPIEALAYKLSSDESYYTVSGIGAATDTDIIIPATYNNLPVTSIGYGAFEYCTSLTSVTIGDSVTSIGSSAFEDCTSLTNVYYEGTANDWNGISIDYYHNTSLYSATRYYYSESQPTESGNYWHYVDGVPTVW